MPCSGGVVSWQANALVEDLLFVHPFRSASLYRPASRPELVSAVVQSARAGHSMRAQGTNWSLSEAGVAQDVVDTSGLALHVSRPYPPSGRPLAWNRLRDNGTDFLQRACTGRPETIGRHYVHVEAGIKIRDLLDDLRQWEMAPASR